MTILDTNFICSLFNQLDSNHHKAKEIFFALDDSEKIAIPFIVAAELCISDDAEKYLHAARLISGRFSPNSIEDLEFITELTSNTNNSNSLKANDCLIIALCHRLDAELLTFDKKLMRAYAASLRPQLK